MKILYYCDPLGPVQEDQELACQYINDSAYNRALPTVTYTTDISYVEEHYRGYSHVVFDFGGLGFGTSTLLEDHQRTFTKLIEENPSIMFHLVSNLPDEYINHEMKETHCNLFIGWTSLLMELREQPHD